MKCTNLLSKPITEFWGSIKCTKLVIDEMYEIGWSIAKFEYEYSRICIISVVRAFLLVVKPTLMWLFWLFELCFYVWLFGVYENSYAIFHKIGLFTLSLKCEREYPYFFVVSVVLGIHEISYAISHKIRL